MKIVFKTLQSIDGVIQLSLDGGKTWTKYSILNIKENGGIPLSDEQDLSLIKIKSDNTILSKMEVISSIGTETVMNMSHIDDLIVDRSLKLDKKDITEEIDVIDTMVAPQFALNDSIMPLYSRNILNFDPSIAGNEESFTDVQNAFKNIPGMLSLGYVVDSYTGKNLIVDPLDGSSLDNFENINYEYHSYDEYVSFLNSLLNYDFLELFDSDSMIEGETKAVNGARIEETDYIIKASKQDGNITLSLEPGDFVDNEGERVRIVFLKKAIVQKINTEYSVINLNGSTLDFTSCKKWRQLSLDNVNKFINKYDSENDIFYSLIATTNNENIPEELRYSIIVYVNYSASGGLPDRGVPYDVWYSTNDDNGFDTYSFNFEFNDSVDIYMNYISNAGDSIWTTNEEGKNVCYALTSADKNGYKFTKESDGTISYEPFNFSTIKEYTPAISFVKKDNYSLYKKFVDKVPQIKIEGQNPQGESLILLDSDGKPSFITIQELKTKLGIS